MRSLLHSTPGSLECREFPRALCSSPRQPHQSKPSGAVWQERWAFWCFSVFGLPLVLRDVDSTQRKQSLGSSFLARGFWSCSRWMGGSHSPLASTRAERGHMSRDGHHPQSTPKRPDHSDTICWWLLWGPAGPVQGWWLWRLEKTGATKWFLGLLPFRVTRSLEP